jgi:Tfp pilus assembly protein PilN
MFTIDLLKGQGIPRRSEPIAIAITAIAVAVPLLVSIVMLDRYLQTRTLISIQRQAIMNHQAEIGKLSAVVEMQESFQKEKALITNGLSEVSSCLVRYIQWSPVLVTLVKNMPERMVLTELSVKEESVRRLVSSKGHPNEMVNMQVPSRILSLKLRGNSQYNCDRAVRDFRDRLKSSTLLGSRLEDIVVSQESDRLEERDVVSYSMDCVFKPQL